MSRANAITYLLTQIMQLLIIDASYIVSLQLVKHSDVIVASVRCPGLFPFCLGISVPWKLFCYLPGGQLISLIKNINWKVWCMDLWVIFDVSSSPSGPSSCPTKLNGVTHSTPAKGIIQKDLGLQEA